MPSFALAQIALLTNLSIAEVVEALASDPTFPPVEDGSELSAEAAERILPALRRLARDRSPRWVLAPGDRVRRKNLHAVYGGNQQYGIVRSSTAPEIFVFTDPAAAEEHGYGEYERPLPDGSYSYTGAGRVGDQSFKNGLGNQALLSSPETGHRIRLFRAKPPYATYIGEFSLGEPRYQRAQIPDTHGTLRSGIIFNLLPIRAAIHLVPDPTLARRAQQLEWSPRDSTNTVGRAEVLLPGNREITRAEFELQTDFGSWLQASGDTVRRLLLPVDGTTIEPDLYVPSRDWVVEAKRSTARNDVRMAVGQVLDYANVARRSGYAAAPMILLPGSPTDSLISLARESGIALAMREAPAHFSFLEPTSR